MRAGDEQLLRWKACDHLAAVLRDDELFFEARRGPAVLRRPIGLEGEDHAFLDRLGIIERDEAAEDRLLPDRKPDAVAVLQRESRLLVGEAELLGLGPELDDVGGRDAGLDDRDRRVHVVAAAL